MNKGAIEVLLEARMTGDIGRAIENQEARGQTAFVTSETLPKDGPRIQLEKMGIVYGEDADNLFVYVQLPEGWEKVATDHSMHSKLIDDQSRERANIFYKAAFYDRRASISIKRRYGYTVQPVCGWGQEFDNETEPRVCVVTDCGEVIWQTEEVMPSEENVWFRLDDVLRPLGLAWLNKHYPDWQDPLAYWD